MGYQIEKEAIVLAAQRMQIDFGGMAKVPTELQDLVASLYYWYHVFLRDSQSPNFSENGLKKWADDTAYWTSTIEAVPNFIEGFSSMSKSAEPSLYNYTIGFVSDCLLYGSSKAVMLPPILKRPLLLFRKKKFHVFPGLGASLQKAA